MNRNDDIKQVVIPKEQAVFWMDGRGRWCNVHGPFEHPKITAHFNKSIGHDKDGFFVEQTCDGVREKVYFHYEDTALFAVDVIFGDPLRLVLNTGQHVGLEPEQVVVVRDALFQRHAGAWIKFTEHVMMRMADMLDQNNDGLIFTHNGIRHNLVHLDALEKA